MVKLTDRLQLMADFATPGRRIADIGTDHGLLPVYLYEQGIAPRAVMCDISEPSLAKAKALAAPLGDRENLLFRAGDGLQVLEAGEVDDIFIAGMGGILIGDILAEDPAKTGSFRRFILQPRNREAHLRYKLMEMGMNICANSLVREGRRICEIIVAEPGGLSETLPLPDSPQLEMPYEYERTPDDLIRRYAGMKIEKYEKIIAGLKAGNAPADGEISSCLDKIEYFRSFL